MLDAWEWSLLGREPGQTAREMVAVLRAEGVPESKVRFWVRAAHAKQIVGRVLAGLSADWTVLHDVPVGDRGGRMDHVLVGPKGVFTVTTKDQSGAEVVVTGSEILVNGEEYGYADKSVWEAQDASTVLSGRTNRVVRVQGVLVFVNARSVTVAEQSPNLLVSTDRDVRGLLESRLTRFTSPAVIEQIAAVATHPNTWVPTGLSDAA